MKSLIRTYQMKISFTLVMWCVPLLLFPHQVAELLGEQHGIIIALLRLLGWAYLALCVGYYVGLVEAKKGVFIKAPVLAGIVSNGGASILIFVTLYQYISMTTQMALGVFLLTSGVGAAYVALQLVMHWQRHQQA